MRKLLMVSAAATLAWAQPAAADTVTDWWDVANRYYNAAQGMPGPRSPDMERVTTRAALAMFEAVNAIDRRYHSHLGMPAASGAASQDAAAATAAHAVLLKHYPANKSALDESYLFVMTAIPDGAAKEAGKAVGLQAAALAMDAGGIDPAVEQVPYRPRTVPGEWVATALPSLDSYWPGFKPWVVDGPEALRPPPPPALTSAEYARDYEEVRRLGGKASSERTPKQTLVARYRQAFDITPSVRLATDAAGRSLVDNARLLAVYQMAFDDAVQAMVVAKQHYDYWRPVTAIRNGDRDGNPATQHDPAWVPLISTPNFQEYPCGHCTAAAVIGEVMKSASGWKAGQRVRVGSLLNPNAVTLTLGSWDEWVGEVSDSRMLGGVHYRFSNEAGEEIGRRAAQIVLAKALQPLARGKRRR
ncbi:vanadium-dependent haloperoxidase [Sphingomonas sp.]|uniref:vanadium-dependent haloperoxidase n=1 Tax=Sphingomonas sp. TaxID=28214 RepID=UPI00286EAF0D|nr:vanadium-dependent haloperoxidase [Sphingomonas sp.]